jgi:hypothetical protein
MALGQELALRPLQGRWSRLAHHLIVEDGYACSPLNLATLGTVPSATNAITSTSATNAAALGGRAPGSFQERVRWAIVSVDGKIVAQSGGITDVHDPVDCNPRCDFLNFGSSQAGKGITVSGGLGVAGFGVFRAGLCGGESNPGGSTRSAGPSISVNDANHILVLSGDVAGAAADREYYIAVIG